MYGTYLPSIRICLTCGFKRMALASPFLVSWSARPLRDGIDAPGRKNWICRLMLGDIDETCNPCPWGSTGVHHHLRIPADRFSRAHRPVRLLNGLNGIGLWRPRQVWAGCVTNLAACGAACIRETHLDPQPAGPLLLHFRASGIVWLVFPTALTCIDNRIHGRRRERGEERERDSLKMNMGVFIIHLAISGAWGERPERGCSFELWRLPQSWGCTLTSFFSLFFFSAYIGY